MNHSLQTDFDYEAEDDGVRQPMEYHQDQLVGGPEERMGLLGITPEQMYAVRQRAAQ